MKLLPFWRAATIVTSVVALVIGCLDQPVRTYNDALDDASSVDGRTDSPLVDESSSSPADAIADQGTSATTDAATDGLTCGGSAVRCPTTPDGCGIQHTGGGVATYYDCNPIGTHTLGAAEDACVAYTGSVSLCGKATCMNMGEDTAEEVVCGVGDGKECVCWSYLAADAASLMVGYVHSVMVTPGDTGTVNCTCPNSATDLPWN